MDPQLLSYYEAIERASADMLTAARAGRWDDVVKLEGACVLLISQLKTAALRKEEDPAADAIEGAPSHTDSHTGSHTGSHTDRGNTVHSAAMQMKARIMRRILVNDAEIRQLAEPWLQDLDNTLAARRPMIH